MGLVSLISRFLRNSTNSEPDESKRAAIAYVERGRERYRRGDRLGALGDYNRAIQLDAKCAPAFNSRGNAHYHYGDVQAGIADYEYALQLDPNFASAYYNRACAFAKDGDIHFALDYLKEAISRDTKYVCLSVSDEDFDGLRGNAEFVAMTTLAADAA